MSLEASAVGGGGGSQLETREGIREVEATFED